MIIASAITLKNVANQNTLMAIDSIYLSTYGWRKKEWVYDFLKNNTMNIHVGSINGPILIPCLSSDGEKYVKSFPNNETQDNLLNLPKYAKI